MKPVLPSLDIAFYRWYYESEEATPCPECGEDVRYNWLTRQQITPHEPGCSFPAWLEQEG
jgi:hypothetical protein